MKADSATSVTIPPISNQPYEDFLFLKRNLKTIIARLKALGRNNFPGYTTTTQTTVRTAGVA